MRTQELAWANLCHHCDGIALGPLVEALTVDGAFALLAGEGMNAEAFATRLGYAPGFAALVLKLLRSQGFAIQEHGRTHLTRTGEILVSRADLFAGACARTGAARRLLRGVVPERTPWPGFMFDAFGWRLYHSALGPLAAASWFLLAREGVLERLGAGMVVAANEPQAYAFQVLEAVGWLSGRTDGHELTDEGRAARGFTSQYAYPLSYLATFEAAPDLLRRGEAPVRQGDDEGHVDRALDIAFSGEVFERNCGVPFFDIALPLFDTEDLASQPRAVVDTGSGDGTLLASLFEAILRRTRRGAGIASAPLVLVGIEFNEVARRATAARLSDLGVPHLALPGDIGRPDEIAAALAERGIAPGDVLHVSKSVIHNRPYRPPRRRLSAPPTDGVFCAPGGGRIDADAAYSSLVELFEGWAPHLGAHGMIAIEAHTVAPEQAAAHVGRSLITSLDAAHGLSCQYLVEIDVHRRAAAEAGLFRIAQRNLGERMMGAPIMSVDHLINRQ